MLVVISGTVLLILNEEYIGEQQRFNIINGTRGGEVALLSKIVLCQLML